MSPLFALRSPLQAAPSLVVLSLLVLAGLTGGCQPQDTAPVQPAAQPAVQPTVEVPPAVAPRRAEVGVGRQGRSLDDNTGVGGMIAQPAVTLFAVKERVVFEIQIPQALQLFEATEGRKPKSHEEFMEKIVTANRIPLPELPEGSEYRYDPEKGELWVYPSN